MRVTIRVRPGAGRTAVGGGPLQPTPRGPALPVSVTAPPAEGKATEAALRAIANAFGVPRRDVRLVTGAASRVKVVDIGGADDATLRARLAALAADSGPEGRTPEIQTPPSRG
jgi:uncharacterized protein YggU (UPF0235/DUF167 family)